MSIWRTLLASLWAAFAAIAIVVALLPGVLGNIYLPAATIQVSIIWVVVALIVVGTVLLTAWRMVMAAQRSVRQLVPRTRAATVLADDPQAGALAPVVLLLDSSDRFGFDVLVATYYTKGRKY